MEVPVDDQDPLHPVPGHGVPRTDRNIVKDAETRRRPQLGVMARRADQGKGVVRCPDYHRVDGVHHAARREPGNLVSLGCGDRVRIEHEHRLPGRGGDGGDVSRPVDTLQFGAGGLPCVNPDKFPYHIGIVQHLVYRNQPLRRLGMGKFGAVPHIPPVFHNPRVLRHRPPFPGVHFDPDWRSLLT